MKPLLGCIADDVTGGTDLALTLSASGFRVVQIFGAADCDPPEDVDAVVISLKIRSEPSDVAIDEAIAAARTLRLWDTQQIFYKYCSTFDSTSKGNIGPVAAMLAKLTNAPITPFVPSFPENGRTVYQGHLFVDDLLLSNSSMRNHPLTPMHDADLRVLLQAQSEGNNVGLVPFVVVEAGAAAIKREMVCLSETGVDFVIIDTLSDGHLRDIGKACAGLPLITGGSGVARGLAKNFDRPVAPRRTQRSSADRQSGGPLVILSGSCSDMSNQQVAYAEQTMPVLRLKPCAGEDASRQVGELATDAAKRLEAGPVVIASTAQPDDVSLAQRDLGRTQAGKIIEKMFADLAEVLFQKGVRNFVIGGGETSGAVAAALKLKMLHVGEEIAPGVPWMYDVGNGGVQIAFKSGNFGAPSFFCDAADSLSKSGETT